ncbi:hypothetical protein M2333_002668 [Sphingobium sp. B11D3B]|uniref:hypothetical protein n=1 Tax=Sphingobium sp. B11D3B TaxID=2940575 RepID=UPI002227D1CE|nr:hypothetical protein [Sphingobium sp. B11D3B]MCW2389622.1 hypothetical protein [Sphingobium sp. B11D3B]
MRGATLGWISGLLGIACLVHGQQPAPAAAQTPLAGTNNKAGPDTRGTGPYPALKEIDPALPNHVVYRPANLAGAGTKSLGIVLWGNGSCSADGASARLHLLEIASHGYVVIAPGRIYSGPGSEKMPASTLPPTLVPTVSGDLRVGLEWLLAENMRPTSPYYGRLDPQQIAASGYSCGGLQAIDVSSDPRIRTVIMHNSGIFSDGPERLVNLPVRKTALGALQGSILYVIGGARDVAYESALDDYDRIHHVPVALLNIDRGHDGTFDEPNGGAAARVAVDWLNWRLRGDDQAAHTFRGPDCRLCQDPDWTIRSKHPQTD